MSASQTFNKEDSSRLNIVTHGAEEDCPCHVYFGLLKNRLNDATSVYGPHKTLYKWFKRWSENSVFECIFKELVKPQTIWKIF